METIHDIKISDARDLAEIDDQTIDLVVTSPPYPMIKMWDELFSNMSDDVGKALLNEKGDEAFELMHLELDKVWKELFRVTKKGAFVCINIGDATRTVNKKFQLYSNHSRIITKMKSLGFDTLPTILWRKQTNAPNKFMGSGMLPSGAYVTLEHEYILIFRKNNKRQFITEDEKLQRMESSFFWEERNKWFSDLWDFKGTTQILKNKMLRDRSAAYPFELAYRLINMYSLKEDLVLDPFLGTGTTTYACMATGRNSIGIEIDQGFSDYFFDDLEKIKEQSNNILFDRIEKHQEFISEYTKRKGLPKHINSNYDFNVITRQETKIILNKILEINKANNQKAKVLYQPIELKK